MKGTAEAPETNAFISRAPAGCWGWLWTDAPFVLTRRRVAWEPPGCGQGGMELAVSARPALSFCSSHRQLPGEEKKHFLFC